MGFALITAVGDEDGRVYFDAVYDNDMKVLFNARPEATRAWLLDRPELHNSTSVCYGDTRELVSVPDYFEGKRFKK